MAKKPTENLLVFSLRSGAAVGTGLTSDDPHVLATDLKSGRLLDGMSGIGLLHVEDAEAADADETYVVKIIGRDSDTAAYETLCTFTVTRGTAGEVFAIADIARFPKQLNYEVDVGGTTPSLVFSLCAIATELRQGHGNAVISS